MLPVSDMLDHGRSRTSASLPTHAAVGFASNPELPVALVYLRCRSSIGGRNHTVSPARGRKAQSR